MKQYVAMLGTGYLASMPSPPLAARAYFQVPCKISSRKLHFTSVGMSGPERQLIRLDHIHHVA